MDVEHPKFEEYERRFRQLAEASDCVKGADPAIASAQYHLCLYGENGMSPDEELALLDKLEAMDKSRLKCAEVETYYWEDLLLYVP